MKRAVVVLSTILTWATPLTAKGSDCFCDEEDIIFFYTTVIPDEAIWMTLYHWEVVHTEPIFNLRSIDEEIVGCWVGVRLVDETLTFDEYEQIFYGGSWVEMDIFEAEIWEQQCLPPLS